MWCLRKNEVAILKRAERSMLKSICSMKLVDKRNPNMLIDMLRFKEAADKLARVNGVRWYGRVLKRPEEDILTKAMVHLRVNKKVLRQMT